MPFRWQCRTGRRFGMSTAPVSTLWLRETVMICAGRRKSWVMVGVSLAMTVAGAQAEAGLLIRNPYVEGYRVINRPRLIGSTGAVVDARCVSSVATVSSYDADTSGRDESACWSDTTLVLRVPENATVWVNGHETAIRGAKLHPRQAPFVSARFVDHQVVESRSVRLSCRNGRDPEGEDCQQRYREATSAHARERTHHSYPSMDVLE